MINFFAFGANILNKTKGKKLSNSSSIPSTDPGSLEHKGQFYEIRVKGQLSPLWSDWFEGLTIESVENGETLLCGYIADQSALMGILNKLVRLNLTLLSINEIKNKEKK